jgi:hypothetical protein
MKEMDIPAAAEPKRGGKESEAGSAMTFAGWRDR